MSDYLPADALISILTLLPPISLVQLRCVCKTWQSLITSHDFICAYLQSTTKPPLLLLRHTDKYGEELYSLRSDDADFTSLRDFICPFKTHSGCFFRVVGCCNGVICLSDDFACYNYTIILWNPSIRRYLILPRPNLCRGCNCAYMFSLGLGFDPITNDHKMIRIVYERPVGQPSAAPKVEIYSLRTGLWKTIMGAPIGYSMVELFGTSVFVNGGVHWLAYSGSVAWSDGNKSYRNIIIVFDVQTEVFRELNLPEELVLEYPLYLGVVAYRDSISVCQYEDRQRYGCDGFTMWVMNQYGKEDSWSKLLTGSLSAGVSSVLGFKSNGEVVVESGKGKLVSCQPGTYKKMGIGGGLASSFYLGTFVESMILIDVGNVVQTEDIVSDGVENSTDKAFDLSSGISYVDPPSYFDARRSQAFFALNYGFL